MKLPRGLDILWGQKPNASNSLSNVEKRILQLEPANRLLLNKLGCRFSELITLSGCLTLGVLSWLTAPPGVWLSGKRSVQALGPGQPPGQQNHLTTLETAPLALRPTFPALPAVTLFALAKVTHQLGFMGGNISPAHQLGVMHIFEIWLIGHFYWRSGKH